MINEEEVVVPQETGNKEDLSQFIADLNGDLELERQAQIQYEQHSALLTGPYFAFAEDLLTHAEDERRHANLLNDLIVYLGGTPSVKMATVKTASNNETMFHQDETSERTAINRYRERLAFAWYQCNNGDLFYMEVIPVLQEIIKDEMHHDNDLKSILGL
jgi:bacterioferritin